MTVLTRTVAAFCLGSLLFLAGCDSLNLEPKDELGAEKVFNDPALAKSYLNEVYTRTGLGYGDPMPTPGVVDEALNTHGHPGTQNIQSTLTPGDRGIWDQPGWRPPDNPPYQGYNWNEVYSSIRDLNLFIQNVQGSGALPEDTKQTLLGEAYFLKGFFFQNLMKLYGGIPVIDRVFELQGDVAQYQVERSTFKATVDAIVADLDSAATRLGMEPRRKGAATKGAAMALKSRVLLYAASDLYAGSKSPFSGSNKAKYVSYTEGNQQARWERARDAAEAVMDLNAYSLEQTSTSHEYHELFTKGNESGTIWARYFNEDANYNHDQSTYVSPNGYFSWSGDTPTQQHVNAYENADGSQFQWEGGDPSLPNPEESAPNRDSVDAENPYKDRDPRLYANIHFSGADWRPRPAGKPRSVDPAGVVQTGLYQTVESDGSTSMTFGLDTDAGPQPWNSSRTGYNLRKFVDRDIVPHQEQAYNPWIFIRYAEILLNHAEAEAELGNAGEAVTSLNKVRRRVGMPDVPTDGGPNRTLMQRIRQEREVELAYEGHRYFDVRRWKLPEDNIPGEPYQDAHGIEVTGHLKGDPSQYQGMALGELIAQDSYNYFFKVKNLQERDWKDKNYFLPFPNDEMNRNPNLVQNPGYGN